MGVPPPNNRLRLKPPEESVAPVGVPAGASVAIPAVDAPATLATLAGAALSVGPVGPTGPAGAFTVVVQVSGG